MATVNDPFHPDRIREGLEELRDLVTSIAGREAALHRAHGAEIRSAEQTRLGSEEQETAQHLSARERRIRECESVRSETERKWAARRERIVRAAQVVGAEAPKPGGLSPTLRRAVNPVGPGHGPRDIRDVWDNARQEHREFVQVLANDLDEIGSLARQALKPLRSFRALFGGMIRKGRWMSVSPNPNSTTREDFHRDAREHLSVARDRLRSLRRNPLAVLFRWFPLGAMLVLVAVGFAWRIHLAGDRPSALEEWGALLLPVLAAPLALHGIAIATLWTPVRRMARALQAARVACDAAANTSQAELTGLAESLRTSLSAHASKEHREEDPGPESAEAWRAVVESRSERLLEKASALHKKSLERIGKELEEDLVRLDAETARAQEACRVDHEARLAAAGKRLSGGLVALRTEWDERVRPLHLHFAGLEERLKMQDDPAARSPNAGGIGPVLPVGRIRVILENLVGGMPDGDGFGLEGDADFDIPLALGFPGRTSLVAEGGADEVAQLFGNLAARAALLFGPDSFEITVIDSEDSTCGFPAPERFIQSSAIRVCRKSDGIESALAGILERTQMAPPEDLFGVVVARSDKQVRHLVIVMDGSAVWSGTMTSLLERISAEGVLLFIRCGPSVPSDPAWRRIESGCLKLAVGEGRILVAGFPAGADVVTIPALPEVSNPEPVGSAEEQAEMDSQESSDPIRSGGKVERRLANNRGLAALLEDPVPDGRFRVWLGESVPGGAVAREIAREKGSHLMAVGGTGQQTTRLMELTAVCLAAACSEKAAQFWVIDASRTAKRLAGTLPHEVRAVGTADIGAAFGELAGELDRRISGGDAFPEVFVLIPSLHRCRTLRYEEDLLFSFEDGSQPNPAKVLGRIATEGGAVGIHLLAGVDTGANAVRWLSREALSGFATRVFFKAGAAGELAEIPGNLKPDQAWLSQGERSVGQVIRPYEDPGTEWWAQCRRRLQESLNVAGD